MMFFMIVTQQMHAQSEYLIVNNSW